MHVMMCTLMSPATSGNPAGIENRVKNSLAVAINIPEKRMAQARNGFDIGQVIGPFQC